ncbi:MAG: glycosyl transferase family 2 [uncultured bacterium]|nr:MAG: glycosyl transferase family 2 [uncultured bacterium]OGT25411.1 MAG: hypothetical protein A3B71_05010 [Gammaproteobacteria bacterium RIFCSPHIGHO2_02_FULL_42_43]OGT28913.1 MAG: hypothetical protein A2624_02335 [Gammaproteobacteria bacterium RIFCSPHIGHO2_01_FULL_42_8]OGT51363.1 MAG: hypothetical protein A3E54_04775 [Gammaproteobacteria bacterium RIFCSPHIGHO2_12_FULL_41_25]OGT62065.1 MAG: hypothetical protein A3I77_03705 [Gammaproteobacteria bacterium RIFCSPLOWO2_02_FULL_42_14]OGT85737.1 M
MRFQLAVVILTYNESVHIERVINNVINWADKVIVLDSYSQDNTTEIAQKMGAEVIFRKFDHYKNQRQHAIEYCKNLTQWMLFLDADEYLLPELKAEISLEIKKPSDISGYYINRRAIFMDRWIKRGGYYPCYLLRLFQPETGVLDEAINEHVTVTGKTKKLKNDFVDHSLKDIAFWTEKHNKYTDLEAKDLWEAKTHKVKSNGLNLKIQVERKKWIRENIWNHLPLLFKPIFYFIYRYFFRLGFLDGKEGFIYHLLQGGWRYFLVDVKYIEMKKNFEQVAFNEINHTEKTI